MYISELKNGDQIFQKNKFNIRDYNTYMSPFIYFGLNLWNWILRKPIVPINHVCTFYWDNITPMVYEAKVKFKKTNIHDKLSNIDIEALYVKRYPLNLSQQFRMKRKAVALIGTNYDFMSILKQYFRQLFYLKIDLETNPSKFKNIAVNCSEGNAEQLKDAGIFFKNTKSVSPADLWLDNRSEFIGRLK